MRREARRAITQRLDVLRTRCAEITGLVEHEADTPTLFAALAALRAGLDQVDEALAGEALRAHPRLVRKFKKLLG